VRSHSRSCRSPAPRFHGSHRAAAFAPDKSAQPRRGPADLRGPLCLPQLFGFPTGVGALVARREATGVAHAAEVFRAAPWDFVLEQPQNRNQLRRGGSAFEDGTPGNPQHSAVGRGLTFLRGIGSTRQSACVSSCGMASSRHQDIAHANGEPLRRNLRTRMRAGQGSDQSRSISGRRRADDQYQQVKTGRDRSNRGCAGCFCNPGAEEGPRVRFEAAGDRRCITRNGRRLYDRAFAACLGDFAKKQQPSATGRASFGVPTTRAKWRERSRG